MTDRLSIAGAITGALGLSVSLLVYFRDAPRVKVLLLLDKDGWGVEPHAVVVIANVGRRAIYLERAHIPGLSTATGAVIFAGTHDHIALAEGSKPYVSAFSQSGLEEEPGFATEWWRIRVKVWDAGGRAFLSRWVTEKPSFAQADAPPLVLVLAKALNSIADLRLRFLA